jgi:hypothetical protein
MAWQASAESEKVKKSAGRPSIGSCGNSPIPHESSNIFLWNHGLVWFIWYWLSLSLYIHILYIIIYIYRHIGVPLLGVFHIRGKAFLWSKLGAIPTPKKWIPGVQEGWERRAQGVDGTTNVWPPADFSSSPWGFDVKKSREFSNEHGLTCKIGVSNKESGKHQNTVPNVS